MSDAPDPARLIAVLHSPEMRGSPVGKGVKGKGGLPEAQEGKRGVPGRFMTALDALVDKPKNSKFGVMYQGRRVGKRELERLRELAGEVVCQEEDAIELTRLLVEHDLGLEGQIRALKRMRDDKASNGQIRIRAAEALREIGRELLERIDRARGAKPREEKRGSAGVERKSGGLTEEERRIIGLFKPKLADDEAGGVGNEDSTEEARFGMDGVEANIAEIAASKHDADLPRDPGEQEEVP